MSLAVTLTDCLPAPVTPRTARALSALVGLVRHAGYAMSNRWCSRLCDGPAVVVNEALNLVPT